MSRYHNLGEFGSAEIHAAARRRDLLADAARDRVLYQAGGAHPTPAARRAGARWGTVVRVLRGGAARPAPTSPAAA